MIVASLPLLGHSLPMAVIVREMVKRGHDVTWATGAPARSIVEKAGARFWPLPYSTWTPCETLQVAVQRCVDWAPDQATACKGLPPGPILADPSMVGVHQHAMEDQRDLFLLGMIPYLGHPEGSRIFQLSIPDTEPLDTPEGVEFVGPLGLPTTVGRPPWWREFIECRRPRIIITQGTLETDVSTLIAPALEGLGYAAVGVIATCDPNVAPHRWCAKWVNMQEALMYADCLVTNGGYGGVQHALAAGVPVVVAGTTDDKIEVGNRVTYSGVGVYLPPPYTPERIRMAVAAVLLTPRFKERAKELAGRCPGRKAEETIVSRLEQSMQKAAA